VWDKHMDQGYCGGVARNEMKEWACIIYECGWCSDELVVEL